MRQRELHFWALSAFSAVLLSAFLPAGIPVLLTAAVALIFWVIELLGKSK
jgi:hypothetical protein